MKSDYLKYLLCLPLVMGLASCGDNDDDDSDNSGGSGSDVTEITVTPSLGRIQNADVRILDIDQVLIPNATGELNSDGSVTLDIPASVTGPIIVEVLGDADATYFNEATGTEVPFGDGERLRAVLPSPQASVGVTPLTEIATNRLITSDGSTVADVNAANEAVRDQFVPGIDDITTPPTLIDSVDDTAGVDTDAGIHALFLATLSELADEESVSLVDFVEQLSDDFSDGNLDGSVDGLAISSPVIDTESTEFDASFDSAIEAAVSGFGADGVTAEDLQAEIDDDDNGGGGGDERICAVGDPSDASLPLAAAINSQVIDFEVDFIVSGQTYRAALGETVEVTFSGSGFLFIENELFSEDPYTCGDLTEINWYNAETDELYAVSFTAEDDINELNYSAGDPLVFTAQLKVDEGDVVVMPDTYSISGNIENTDTLSGQWELFFDDVLANDGSLNSGAVIYSSDVEDGSSYEVRPSNSDCSVSNGSGVVSGANITDVDIDCSVSTVFNELSGTILNSEGLSGQWEVRVNGTFITDGPLTNGSVAYIDQIENGFTYDVSVSNSDCSVSNASGTVSADVTDINITCISGNAGGGTGTNALDIFAGQSFAPQEPSTPVAVQQFSTDPSMSIPALYADATNNIKEALFGSARVDVSRTTIAYEGDGTTYRLAEYVQVPNSELELPIRVIEYSAGPDGMPQTSDDIPVEYLIGAPNEDFSGYLGVYGFSAPGPDDIWFTEDDFYSSEVSVGSYFGFFASPGLLSSTIDNNYLIAGQGFFQGVGETRFDSGDDGILFSEDDVISFNTLAPGAYMVITVGDNESVGQSVIYNGNGDDGIWFTADDDIGFVIAAESNSSGTEVGSTSYDGSGSDGVWFTDDDDVISHSLSLLNSDNQIEYTLIFTAEGTDGNWFTADDTVTYTFYGYDTDGEPSFVATHSNVGIDGIWFTSDDTALAQVSKTDDNTRFNISISGMGADNTWLTGDDQVTAYSLFTTNDEGLPLIDGFSYSVGDDGMWLTDDDLISSGTVYEYDSENRLLKRTNISAGATSSIFAYAYTAEGGSLVALVFDAGVDAEFGTADDFAFSVSPRLVTVNGEEVSAITSMPGADTEWFTDDDVFSSYNLSEEISANLSGVTTYLAGVDGEILTADDVVSAYLEIEGTEIAEGTELITTSFSFGADEIFGTDDDVIISISEQVTGSDGQILERANISAGNDGILGTSDDFVSSEDSFNQDGSPTSTVFRSAIDMVTYYAVYTYDSMGEQASFIEYRQGGSEGADGILFTDDDIPNSATIYDVSNSFADSTASNTGFAGAICDVNAGATGSINVTVVDGFGLPVEDATLMLGTGITVLTDSSGVASFSSLVGSQDIHVLKEGYEWESFLCVEPGTDTALASVIHPLGEDTNSRINMSSNTIGDLILLLDDEGNILADNVSNGQDFPSDLRLLSTHSTLYFDGVAVGTDVTGDLWAIDYGRVGSNTSYTIFSDAVLIEEDVTLTTGSPGFNEDVNDLSYTFAGMATIEQVECGNGFGCQSGALRWENGLGTNGFFSFSTRTNVYEFADNLPIGFEFADITESEDFGDKTVVTALPNSATALDISSLTTNSSLVVSDGRFAGQDAMGLTTALIEWTALRQVNDSQWFVGHVLVLDGYDTTTQSSINWTLHMPAGVEQVELPVLPSPFTDISIGTTFQVEQTYRTNEGNGYQNWIQSDGFRELPVGVDAEERSSSSFNAFTR